MLPIEKDTNGAMRELARCVEQRVGTEEYGFMVLVFPWGAKDTVAHYISNASRVDMIRVLREKADVLERKMDIEDKYGTQ